MDSSSPDKPIHVERDVFAVVVTYNGGAGVGRCLSSLINAGISANRLLVVDNASTDGTADRARQVAPVRVLAQAHNVGFGRGCNIGFRVALREGAKAVMLLNQDACVQPNAIGLLVDEIARSPDTGILSPLQLSDDGLEIDARHLGAISRSVPSLAHARLHDLGTDRLDVPAVNAAAWMISRQCLSNVGGFDPLFFMYGEDDDYCARVCAHHLRVAVLSGAHVCHARHRSWLSLDNPRLRASAHAIRQYSSLLVELKDPARNDGDLWGLFMGSWRQRCRQALANLARGHSEHLPGVALAGIQIASRMPRILRHRQKCRIAGPTFLDNDSR